MHKAKRAPRQRRAKREKPVYESLVYRTAELVARYCISRRTLRRWSDERGYPQGEKNGRDMKYAKLAVHEWERVNWPGLYVAPEPSAEDKLWTSRHLAWKAEKAELAARPPPKRPGRVARH